MDLVIKNATLLPEEDSQWLVEAEWKGEAFKAEVWLEVDGRDAEVEFIEGLEDLLADEGELTDVELALIEQMCDNAHFKELRGDL